MHDEFSPKLTNEFHVYGITRRGIGASDKPSTGYTVQRSANDVLEVLDSLNPQKSVLEVAADFDIRNERERAALHQQYAATRSCFCRMRLTCFVRYEHSQPH